MDSNKYKQYIEEIDNFPIEGINFKDITSVLLNSNIWINLIDDMVFELEKLDFDVLVGPEARSFIFLGALSYRLNKPFVVYRKKGKLPRTTINASYNLEYGSDSLFVHEKDIKNYKKAVIVDDLLATGGTISTINSLHKKIGIQNVCNLFFIELEELKGRNKLDGKVISLVKY